MSNLAADHPQATGTDGISGYLCQRCGEVLSISGQAAHAETCPGVDHTRRATYRIAAALERIADCMERADPSFGRNMG